MKKLILTFFGFFIILIFSGCQDYRGLDEITIVAGIAIDQSEKNPNMFDVTFEIVDNDNADSGDQPSSHLITSHGSSVFEAMMKANTHQERQLYFGNTEVVVISEKIAESGALVEVLDTFLRDYYIRDTVFLIISKENTAREIFEHKIYNNKVVSFILKNTMADADSTTESTHRVPVYRAYSQVISDRSLLTLPAFKFFDNESEDDESNDIILMPDGVGIFEDTKMTSYLEQSDIPTYLMSTEDLNGGNFVAFIEKKKSIGDFSTISLAIDKTTRKITFKPDEDELVFYVDIYLETAILALSSDIEDTNHLLLEDLSILCAEQLNEKVGNLIGNMQKEKKDIFGFADALYRKDFKRWEKIKDNWDEEFSKAKIIVRTKFLIQDTGMINAFYQVEEG